VRRKALTGAALSLLASAFVLISAGPALADGGPSPAGVHRHPGHVVLVGWDGFDPRYLALVPTPNLHALAAHGRLTRALGTFPTISNPSWTSVATGAWPEVHGNAAYTFDRAANVAVGQTRTMNAPSIAEAIGDAGGTFASVNWYVVQNHGATYGDPKHLYVQAAGGCRARTDAALDLLAGRPVDSGGTAVRVPQVPDLTALYCDELDALGHAGGNINPAIGPALAELDRQLGRLVQGLKDDGVYADTTFILTGDHGMATFTKAIGPTVLEALTAQGYHPQLLDPGTSPAPGTDVVIVVGGVANVYLLPPRRTAHDIARVARVLARVPHVTHVYGRAALHRFHASSALGDLVAEPEVGWTFGASAPPGPAGYHGLSVLAHPAFLIAGHGIRPNAWLHQPRLIDIAPTIAKLLDIPPPVRAQGRPLVEAFAPR
jgi:arylsulfatase A-like enzyme